MKRATYAELQAACTSSQKRASLNAAALQSLALGEFRRVWGTFTHDGWRYKLQVARLAAPHGGLLLVTSHTAGQRDSVAAYYVEDWLRAYRGRAGSWGPAAWEHQAADAVMALQRAANAPRAEVAS